jgi:hypothetical protein
MRETSRRTAITTSVVPVVLVVAIVPPAVTGEQRAA